MQKRAGRTKTFSISVDEKTRKLLKAEAARHFDGNVSAVVADLAKEIERRNATERVLAWLGADALTDQRREEIDKELGWESEDRRAKKPRKRRVA